MTIAQVRQLRVGDEVHWTDPDEDICSCTFIIGTIDIKGQIVCLTKQDGTYLECWPEELS
jgi:hypothetical protein